MHCLSSLLGVYNYPHTRNSLSSSHSLFVYRERNSPSNCTITDLLSVIIAIGFRLAFLHTELSSSDPTLKGSLAAITTQIQISYAIIAATTPCLRPFMSALSTNYGAPAQIKTPLGTKNNSYGLSSLSTKNRQEKGKQLTVSETAPDTRWDGVDHQASVSAGADNISFDSHSSVQMIIQKNTEWGVEYEGRRGQTPENAHEPFSHA